ncbi:UNVERIFIED_CONTAM: hypothetical protein Sradi_3276000 [Sesamum radiatum]|uniref:Chromo domain-containing protein n=1 Tax=Sesamum radiatum TaxID=300843 RepID=A0AAW2R0I2_SESRA
MGQSKKNRRTDYLVHWVGESEADATWEQDVTLWQFENKFDEYWAVIEGRTPATRTSGSSGGGGFVTLFSGRSVLVRLACASGRTMVPAWCGIVRVSQAGEVSRERQWRARAGMPRTPCGLGADGVGRGSKDVRSRQSDARGAGPGCANGANGYRLGRNPRPMRARWANRADRADSADACARHSARCGAPGRCARTWADGRRRRAHGSRPVRAGTAAVCGAGRPGQL